MGRPKKKTVQEAIEELRSFGPFREVPVSDVAMFEKRQALVAIVEAEKSDPTYITKRNALIPFAEHEANRFGPTNHTAWQQAFKLAMDRLSKEAQL